MASAFNHVKDLNDIALKPRLLYTITKDQLPSVTPLAQSSISSIISQLKTHQLLSQQTPYYSPDAKLLSTWHSSVDSWVDSILTLARSNSTDKCWAGVCLLGVTCVECSTERFLASYSDWFNVLASYIQTTGVSKIVRVASCAAVSDLLTRLGGFLNIKKDGASYAGRLVQPILKSLNEDQAEDLLEVAAHLLFTILTYFPAAVHRHHSDAEAAIASKLMSGNYNADLLKKLSFCLASLPKSRGDDDSWSLMMQKTLLSLSTLLDSALEGLEEESRRGEAVALLVPPGKDPPPFLGSQSIGQVSLINGERSQKFVMGSILSLKQCCCTMLTNYYPVQVAIPVSPLLAIIRRVLMVNGSLPEALQLFTTAMQQEFVCMHLPTLHLNMMEILEALIKGLHSQILPHAADILWLLIKYFERCWQQELRMKVYTIIRSLLIMMGAGVALYISEEVIHNALIDLKVGDSGFKECPTDLPVDASSRNRRKKRKHLALIESLAEQDTSLKSEVKAPKGCQTSISLRIAAVEALEALLIVGGALRSDSWRNGIDCLLFEVADHACRGGWSLGGQNLFLKGSMPAWEDFQLVALRALLASLLSPASTPPPFLAQGLELFRKVTEKFAGKKVAQFCVQALAALEVLIHPRALPLIDAPSSSRSSCLSGATEIGVKYKFGHADNLVHGDHPDIYDILDNMEDVSGSEVPVAEAARHRNLEEPKAINGSLDKMTPKESNQHLETTSIGNQIELSGDRVMLDWQHCEAPDKTSPQIGFGENDTLVVPLSSPFSTKKGLGSDASDANNKENASGFNFLAAKSNATATVDKITVTGRAENSSLIQIVDKDDESSDSFPDIVDAEPDSDSDSDS